ncbi:hypothetical protein ACFL4F_01590 [Candidatus Margulisiibacteriota bacterium]
MVLFESKIYKALILTVLIILSVSSFALGAVTITLPYPGYVHTTNAFAVSGSWYANAQHFWNPMIGDMFGVNCLLKYSVTNLSTGQVIYYNEELLAQFSTPAPIPGVGGSFGFSVTFPSSGNYRITVVQEGTSIDTQYVDMLVDIGAPTAPGNLTTPSPVSSNNVNLSWSASTDDLVGVNVYRIYRNGSSIADTNSTNYSDNVADGTYTYQVYAFDYAGHQSGPSNATTVVVDTSPPNTPANLSAAPISNSVSDLSWTAVSDVCGIDHYNVYRDNAIIAQPNTNSYVDDAPDGNYVYEISAVDNLGRESGLSNQVGVVIDKTPPTVNDFSVDGGNASNSLNITLNIDIPDPASELANDIYIKEGAGDWVAYPNSTTSVPWVITKRDYAAEQAAVDVANAEVATALSQYNYAQYQYSVVRDIYPDIYDPSTNPDAPFTVEQIYTNLNGAQIQMYYSQAQSTIYSRYQACMATYATHQYLVTVLASAVATLNAPDTGRQLEIKVEDTAGNITYESLTVELALTPTFSDIAVNGTSISALSFSTQKSEITAVVRNVYEITSENVKLNIDGQEIDVNSGLVITPIAGEDGAYDLYYQTPEPLSASSHTIVFTATDVYGNEGTSTVSLSMAGVLGVTGKPKIVPNPFAPRTQTVDIQYTLSGNMDITVMVYDITGRSVWRKFCPAGTNGGQSTNNVIWDGRDSANHLVGNGAYVYFITAKGKVLSRGNLAVLD